MQLITPDLAKTIPPLYSQEELGGQAIAYAKFFTPWSNWTWYITEYDPIHRICFGLVEGMDT